MGLFGTDMVQVTTPDGRTLTVPSQLAAQFPGLQPAAPAGPPPDLMAAPQLPNIMAGGPPPSPQPMGPPPIPSANPGPGPVTSPADLSPGGPNIRARGPVTSPTQAAEPGAPNTPRLPSDAEIANRGVAGGLAAENAAYDQQGAAVRAGAQADVEAATALGHAMAKRDDEAAAELARRAKVAADQQQQLDTALNERRMAAKKLADTKIDRSADHPILSAISIVLGAVGTAMVDRDNRLSAAFAHSAPPPTGENPALKLFYAQIDRKVAAQMQDIEKGRGDLGEMDKTIQMMRANGADRLQTMDVLRDAALIQEQKRIETLKTQLGAPRAIANADGLLADIAQKRAASEGQASSTAYQRIQAKQTREDQLRMHRDTLGVQYAGQAQSERHWQGEQQNSRRDFDERKREFDIREANDIKAAEIAAAARGKGKGTEKYAAAQNENEERALSDPSNGFHFLQPEGIAMSKEADGHDKAADRARAALAKETDPAKQSQLKMLADAETQKASELRGEASVDHTWRVGKDERKTLSDGISAAQTIGTLADEITALRAKYGPSWATTDEGQAAMKTKGAVLTAAVKDAWSLGAISGSDYELLNKATGGDPAKLTFGDVSRVFGIEGPGAHLDSLARSVEQQTITKMRAKGFRGDWKVRRDTPAPGETQVDTLFNKDTGKTALETEADSKRTGIAKLAGGGLLADLGLEPKDTSERYPELTKGQGDFVNANIAAYLRARDTGDQATAEKSAQYLLGLASNVDRPKLVNSIVKILQKETPDLYEIAASRLPRGHPANQEREVAAGWAGNPMHIGMPSVTR